jgi:hypothetical protein
VKKKTVKKKTVKKKTPLARKTITFSELQRLSFCDSKHLPLAVDIGGRRKGWVGIGWIDTGKAKGNEVKVVED